MFNIRQANFKSAHLLNKMALVQFQRNSTVPRSTVTATILARHKSSLKIGDENEERAEFAHWQMITFEGDEIDSFISKVCLAIFRIEKIKKAASNIIEHIKIFHLPDFQT